MTSVLPPPNVMRRSLVSFTLPSIPGVLPLSKSEVKKDLKEIESNLPDDSESEDSVKSEDVLSSSYPVKPRRTPKYTNKVTKPVPVIDDNDNERDAAVDDCLEFLRLVETSRHDIFNAEKERQRLEIQYNALRDAFISTNKRFRKDKQEHENLLCALQGVSVRNYSILHSHSQQNAMLFDIFNVLKRRKESASTLENEIDTFKGYIDKTLQGSVNSCPAKLDKEPDAACSKSASTHVTETPLLRVKVRSARGSPDREQLLYCGQMLNTPMGEGRVVSLRPSSQSVVINLQFGVMYSSIERVVSWYQPGPSNCSTSQRPSVPGLTSELDCSSDKAIINRWNKLQNNLQIPSPVARAITESIASAKGRGSLSQSTGDGDATDNDNDDASTAESAAPGDMDVDNDPYTAIDSPALTGLSQSHAEGTNANANATTSRSLTQSQPHMVSRSQSHRAVAVQPPVMTLPPPALKGLPAPHVSAPPPHTLRVQLTHEQQMLPVGFQSLPMTFASADTLPRLLEKAVNAPVPTAQLFKQAFSSSNSFGTQEMQDLQSVLGTLLLQTSGVEQRQQLAMRKMECMRRRLTQITQEMTMTRLAMFSRRVRHSALLQSFPRHAQGAPLAPNGTASTLSKSEHVPMSVAIPGSKPAYAFPATASSRGASSVTNKAEDVPIRQGKSSGSRSSANKSEAPPSVVSMMETRTSTSSKPNRTIQGSSGVPPAIPVTDDAIDKARRTTRDTASRSRSRSKRRADDVEEAGSDAVAAVTDPATSGADPVSYATTSTTVVVSNSEGDVGGATGYSESAMDVAAENAEDLAEAVDGVDASTRRRKRSRRY